jgi:hypothetical protein
MSRPAVATAFLAATLLCIANSHSRATQTTPDVPSNAASVQKACQLMPTADLEKTFGGKVTHPHGIDGDSSICTVNIGALAVKLQSAPPGAADVPTSIAQGLVGARMMLGAAKQDPRKNTRDFGKVGCLRIKMSKGFDGTPLAKPLLTTSCFLVEGGYLNLSLSGENSKKASFEAVKALLEKAATKR